MSAPKSDANRRELLAPAAGLARWLEFDDRIGAKYAPIFEKAVH